MNILVEFSPPAISALCRPILWTSKVNLAVIVKRGRKSNPHNALELGHVEAI